MGINLSKELNQQIDKDGNQKWILPHGMVLQVEDFYEDEIVFKGER